MVPEVTPLTDMQIRIYFPINRGVLSGGIVIGKFSNTVPIPPVPGISYEECRGNYRIDLLIDLKVVKSTWITY